MADFGVVLMAGILAREIMQSLLEVAPPVPRAVKVVASFVCAAGVVLALHRIGIVADPSPELIAQVFAVAWGAHAVKHLGNAAGTGIVSAGINGSREEEPSDCEG